MRCYCFVYSYADGPLPTSVLRKTMQKTMQNHAAVFRDGSVLEEGVEKMKEVLKQFKDIGIKDRGLTW